MFIAISRDRLRSRKKPDCSYSLTRALALYFLFLLQIFFAIPELGALESCNIAESPYLDRSDTQRYPVLACHIRTLFLGLELHRCFCGFGASGICFLFFIYILNFGITKSSSCQVSFQRQPSCNKYPSYRRAFPHFIFDGDMTQLHLNSISVIELILHASSVYDAHRLSSRADRGSSLLMSANFISG